MDKYGLEINPHIERNYEYEKLLIECFNKNYASLLETAIADNTKRRNLTIFLWPYGLKNGSVNYCVKERRFNFIEYSVKTRRGAYYGKRAAL